MDDELSTPMPSELLAEWVPITEDDWASIMETAVAEAEQFDVSVDEVLAESMQQNPVDVGAHTAARWTIEGERDANWAMTRLFELHAEMAGPEALYEQWRTQLETWLTARTSEQRRRAAFLEGQLIRWAAAQRAANPKKATFKLLAGQIKTRLVKETVQIASPPAVVAWAKETRPDLVKVYESVLVSDLRRHVDIVEHVHGTRVRLACGHEKYVTGESARGEVTACSQCTIDATSVVVDGDVMQPVDEVLDVEVEVRVLAGDVPVPGMTVTPAHTDVAVQPFI